MSLNTLSTSADYKKEWLESDGLGGYAMGCGDGIPRRRYHTILTVAMNPPIRRTLMVNAVEVLLKVNYHPGDSVVYPLTSFQFPQKVLHPDGLQYLTKFTHNLWPQWEHTLPGGIIVRSELFIRKGSPLAMLKWWPDLSLAQDRRIVSMVLQVRPFFSCRNHHSLHHKNDQLSFQEQRTPRGVLWKPYLSMPEVAALTNAEYVNDPVWFERVVYEFDEQRGFEAKEDIASPGYFWKTFDDAGLSVAFTVPQLIPEELVMVGDPTSLFESIRAEEKSRRELFTDKWSKAADAYVVRRSLRKSIVAGYPWFSDWGRDTFISLRGLCLATDRLDDALDILLEWRNALSAGMIPNLFPEDSEGRPLYNSIDASLWYAVAAYEFLNLAKDSALVVDEEKRAAIVSGIVEIVEGYSRGTRFGIRCDTDGLIQGGITGTQLTWMDAKVGALVVTPRMGKAVEIQALWINTLLILESLGNITFEKLRKTSEESFANLFWNDEGQQLFDVIDVDFRPGARDATSRPNQLFAVGGLPFQVVCKERAQAIVKVAEEYLLTSNGIRTLSPVDARYRPFYAGGPVDRDKAYHQGTVWPWLLGAFIEAWVRVQPEVNSAKLEALRRFVKPLEESSMVQHGGHIAEIADGAFPNTPRGCPFQAWSLAELIRIKKFLQA